MHARGLQRGNVSAERFKFFQRVSDFKRKSAGLGAPQSAQVRAAAQFPAQFVRHCANISSGADLHGEAGLGALQLNNLKRFDTDPGGL